jgi:phosphonate transport system substrate-binding protein
MSNKQLASNRKLAVLFAVAALVATAVTTATAVPTRDPEVLRVALLPDENASKVIQDNEGLKQYLEQKLSKKIELHVLTSYAAMVEATRNTRIDLAFFGPLSYCMAKDKAAIEPFAAKVKNGSTTYRAVIIAAVGSGIARLEDVRGKRMAYGDTASTSSHLIPKGMLARAGLKPENYQESFLGKHDAVALNVMRGNVDAGGLSQVIFNGLVEKGTIDASKVKVIAESDPIPEYPWVMQADLAPALKERIRTAFLELRDPAILKPLKADSFAAIQDTDYDVIRNAAKILGLDLGSLEK